MNLGLLRENPVDLKTLKEMDKFDFTTEEKITYTLDDILDKLETVNMGRAITTRDESLRPIDIRIILNPYSSMYQMFSGNDAYIKNSINALRPPIDGSTKRFTVQRISRTIRDFIAFEYQHFSNVFPGLTRSNLYRVIMNYKRGCVQIAENRFLSRDVDSNAKLYTKFANNKARLFPLTTEQYYKFARKTYSSLKSPRFNKKFIDSIRFGGARIVSSTSKIGSINKGVMFDKIGVRERHIGLQQFRLPDGHIRLAFEMEDGAYVLAKRNNSIKQHLWSLVRYKVNGSPPFRPKKTRFYGHDSIKVNNKYREILKNGGLLINA